jgi:hypothetical protein
MKERITMVILYGGIVGFVIEEGEWVEDLWFELGDDFVKFVDVNFT